MTTPLSRRTFLVAAGAAATGVALAACSERTSGQAVGPSAAAVGEREDRRRRPGAAVREVALVAAPATVDLGGRTASTWVYGGALPGPLLRLRAGEVLRARLDNRLPAPTSIHWHGIALRNDMDGVPGVTQDPVAPDGSFTYEFTVPDPGTYFFHAHVGVQLDRGLYGTLLVDDPVEPGRYDRELVVVLDDWTDGVGRSPDQVLEDLRRRGMAGMGGMGDMGGMHGGMGDARNPLGGDPGDVRYPLYLVSGRPPGSPRSLAARPRGGCGCGSSTPAPTPPSGSRSPVIASPSPTPTASRSGRSPATHCWSAWASATTPWRAAAIALREMTSRRPPRIVWAAKADTAPNPATSATAAITSAATLTCGRRRTRSVAARSAARTRRRCRRQRRRPAAGSAGPAPSRPFEDPNR